MPYAYISEQKEVIKYIYKMHVVIIFQNLNTVRMENKFV